MLIKLEIEKSVSDFYNLIFSTNESGFYIDIDDKCNKIYNSTKYNNEINFINEIFKTINENEKFIKIFQKDFQYDEMPDKIEEYGSKLDLDLIEDTLFKIIDRLETTHLFSSLIKKVTQERKEKILAKLIKCKNKSEDMYINKYNSISALFDKEAYNRIVKENLHEINTLHDLYFLSGQGEIVDYDLFKQAIDKFHITYINEFLSLTFNNRSELKLLPVEITDIIYKKVQDIKFLTLHQEHIFEEILYEYGNLYLYINMGLVDRKILDLINDIEFISYNKFIENNIRCIYTIMPIIIDKNEIFNCFKNIFKISIIVENYLNERNIGIIITRNDEAVRFLEDIIVISILDWLKVANEDYIDYPSDDKFDIVINEAKFIIENLNTDRIYDLLSDDLNYKKFIFNSNV